MKNLVGISLRLDRDKKERLTKIFEENGETFSSGIRRLCYTYLKQEEANSVKTESKQVSLEKLKTSTQDTSTKSSSSPKKHASGELYYSPRTGELFGKYDENGHLVLNQAGHNAMFSKHSN